MPTAIRYWGHSLSVRIPKATAHRLRIHAGSEVDLRIANGALVLTPLPQTPDLAALLARVRREDIPEVEGW
jgi:antitoxin component of MazEF toxin-antitoxin module